VILLVASLYAETMEAIKSRAALSADTNNNTNRVIKSTQHKPPMRVNVSHTMNLHTGGA
jgi:hypothetical protein